MKQQISADLWNDFETELNKIKDFDISKLQLTPMHNSVLDLFFKKFCDPKEDFPEGTRHTTLEKNFAIYIVSNNIPLEQIQEAYKSKNFDINSLLSQIKGVTSGTYPDPHVNIGELVNWCKQFRPDLVELFAELKGLDETKILRKKDLLFISNHLPMFESIKTITKIKGQEYSHLFKLLHYHITSCSLPKSLILVSFGDITIDLRDYLLLVYPTGYAKGNVKNFLLKVNRALGNEAIPLTSYHEEQLVGKVIHRIEQIEIGTTKSGNPKYKREEKYLINKGHFASDWLSFDECRSLLLEKTKEDSRGYLLQAMDKYKDNEIFKRLTDNLNTPEETLTYYPTFNALFLTQPFMFPEDKIALNGFLKRVTLDYLPPIQKPDSVFNLRLEKKPNTENINNSLVQHFWDIKKITSGKLNSFSNWTFSKGFEEKFKECYLLLRNAGLYNTKKKRNYTKLIDYQLQDRLLRKSCLLAIGTDKKPAVTENHCELAFLDLLEDFIIELDFVNEKVYGDLDYGNVWGTIDNKEKQLKEYLFKLKAINQEDSEITIQMFLDKIQDIYKIGQERARKIYYKLIEKEIIASSRKTLAEESKVWLVRLPEYQTETFVQDFNVKSKYLELCKKHSKGVTGTTGTTGTDISGE